MFFERSKVPATVQDITVAPAGDARSRAAAGEQGAGATSPRPT